MADAVPAQKVSDPGPPRDTATPVRWRPGMPESAKPRRRIPNAKVNENKPDVRPGTTDGEVPGPTPAAVEAVAVEAVEEVDSVES